MSPLLKPRCRGLGLIEVMVATLVLAVGLLGIAGLQTAALANNLLAYQYLQASTLAQALIERMRANRQGVLDGHYLLAADAMPLPAGIDCGSGTRRCSSGEQAQWDLAMLRAQLSPSDGSRLPGGRLSVRCEADCASSALRVVTIYWDAGRSGATGTDCSGGREQLQCLRLGYLP